MATSVEMLIGARLILGLSLGIASYTAPLYLAEMSDKDARGSIISGYQLMVTVGILVAFLSDTYFSYTGDWRAMLMVIAIPAVALILCVLALPESPRWLASKGRFQESANVLSSMHTNVEIAHRLQYHYVLFSKNFKYCRFLFYRRTDDRYCSQWSCIRFSNIYCCRYC